MELNYKKKLLLANNDNPNNYKGLRFTATTDGVQFTFSVSNKIKYKCSYGGNWEIVTAGTKFPNIPLKANEFIIICGKFGEGNSSNGNGVFTSVNNYGFNVSGNIMSLVNHYDDPYYNEFSKSCYKYLFRNLFQDCIGLTHAHNLLLPAETLADGCYSYMFSGCTELTSTPKQLPAGTLAANCYSHMFEYCGLASSIPELPAETLAKSCYSYMFRDCTGLKVTPTLPAKTLANYCYSYMFSGCIGLITSVPQLAAVTGLADYCYSYMFDGCENLTNSNYRLNFSGANTCKAHCYSYMFRNCTSLKFAPHFAQYMTVANNCCSGMFEGCSSLTSAPTLPATTLADSCYSDMFKGCSSLTSAPTLPATTLADSCYSGMFSGCTKLSTAPTLPATTLADSCYTYMFDGCENLTSAPTLSATTLANSCYSYMFNNCTRLTSTPTLPATTLAANCYSYMFKNCSSLTNIAISAKTPKITTSSQVSYATDCYVGMCVGCSSLNQIKLDDIEMWGGYYTDSNGNSHTYTGDDANLRCTNFVGGYSKDWWLDGVKKAGTFTLSSNAKLGYHDEQYFDDGAGQRFGVIPADWGLNKI